MLMLHFNEKELNHHFLPLTYTRNFKSLICGVLSFEERWKLLARQNGVELQFVQDGKDAFFSMQANCIPHLSFNFNRFQSNPERELSFCEKIERPWDIIQQHTKTVESDIQLLSTLDTYGNTNEAVNHTGKHHLYIHPKSRIESCFIHTEDGPVLIEEGALIMQGAMLRGPLYIGKHAVVKMGSTLYGGTSIGHHCVVGGEIKNSIFYPYSNKAHHGYIGDSMIGSWCNLGAGTTCSNLKNTVGKIKVWDIHTHSFKLSVEKMGILMGDHVRTAVNTSFNSGTVIGAFANIFELQGLSPKYIPAFSWGGTQNSMYTLDKLIEDTGRWMNLKDVVMSEHDKEQIVTLYNQFNKV